MYFCPKGSQTAAEYSKDDMTREKWAVSLNLGGHAFKFLRKNDNFLNNIIS